MEQPESLEAKSMVRKLMERIRFVGPAANRMTTTRIDGRQHVMTAPIENSYIGANAYWDGGQWMRYDVARGASLTVTVWNGTIEHRYAPAGANPIAWTTSYLATGSDSGWLAVGNYAANWQTYSASWLPYYRKFPDGMVHLRGLVAKNAAAALPEIMFTLPAGYRPGAVIGRIYPAAYHAGNCEIRIHSTGAVVIQTGGSGGLAQWISLDGIQFFAEN